MEKQSTGGNALHSPLSISHNELKFRLTYARAEAVYDTVRANLPRYEFKKGFSPTRISTMYFDTSDLMLGRKVIASPAKNMKIRVREYYYDTPDGPVLSPYVWVEMKFRSGRSVSKKRFRLVKESLGDVWKGVDISDALMKSNPRAGSWAVSHYNDLMEFLAEQEFRPSVVTHYSRSVFQDAEAKLRFTFDRDISFHRPPDNMYNTCKVLSKENLGELLGREDRCILEIKDHNTIPDWLKPHISEKDASAYSKFSTAVSLLLGEPAGK